jgi:hypothetical protein
MKNKISIVLLVFLGTLNGCKKDITPDTASVKDKLKSYFNAQDQLDNNGSLFISSYRNNFGSNTAAIYQINGSLFDKGNNRIAMGDLKINESIFNATAQGFYNTTAEKENSIKTLFGSKLNFQGFKNSNGLSTRDVDLVFQGSITLPQEMIVSSPVATAASAALNRNQVIRWNGDSNNPKNVIIGVEFDPRDNPQFSGYSRTGHFIEVPDNGYYQLNSSLFSDIPNNAPITVFVARGNYTKVYSTNGTEVYSVNGYTAAEQRFDVQ